jgi:putative salt-induced outer membrane protein YdiY
MRTTTLPLILLISFTLLIPVSSADEIYLKNGDRLTGEIMSSEAQTHVLKTEALGTLTIRQDLVEKIIRHEETPAKLWQNEITLGFDRSRGNTSATELNTTATLNRKTDHDELTLKGFGYYSERKRQTDAERYGGSIRYAYSFGNNLKWYSFYKTAYDHDRFGNIRYRIIPSIGLGYWFSDAADWKLMTEVGLGVTHTNFEDATDESTELDLIPRLFVQKKIFRLMISQELLFYPSLTNEGEYRFHSETMIENPLNQVLSLRLSLIDDFNSDPGGDTKENDLRIITSIAYDF